MEIKALKIELIDVDAIIENPRNTNMHPDDQLRILNKGVKYTGFRVPLIVSNRTGFLITGHARLAVAKLLGMTKLPVIYQDFDNEAEEFAFLNMDNEIARQSKFDLEKYNFNLEEIEIPDALKINGNIDHEFFGLDYFNFADINKDIEDIKSIEGASESFTFKIKCDSDDELDRIAGLLKVKSNQCNYGSFMDFVNENINT